MRYSQVADWHVPTWSTFKSQCLVSTFNTLSTEYLQAPSTTIAASQRICALSCTVKDVFGTLAGAYRSKILVCEVLNTGLVDPPIFPHWTLFKKSASFGTVVVVSNIGSFVVEAIGLVHLASNAPRCHHRKGPGWVVRSYRQVFVVMDNDLITPLVEKYER
jgi:hypothetical protein